MANTSKMTSVLRQEHNQLNRIHVSGSLNVHRNYSHQLAIIQRLRDLDEERGRLQDMLQESMAWVLPQQSACKAPARRLSSSQEQEGIDTEYDPNEPIEVEPDLLPGSDSSDDDTLSVSSSSSPRPSVRKRPRGGDGANEDLLHDAILSYFDSSRHVVPQYIQALYIYYSYCREYETDRVPQECFANLSLNYFTEPRWNKQYRHLFDVHDQDVRLRDSIRDVLEPDIRDALLSD